MADPKEIMGDSHKKIAEEQAKVKAEQDAKAKELKEQEAALEEKQAQVAKVAEEQAETDTISEELSKELEVDREKLEADRVALEKEKDKLAGVRILDIAHMKAGASVYVCSKLASDNAYTTWHPGQKSGGNDMPRKDRQILIKGGSGVINKQLVTPHGVVTKITKSELELARECCPSFVRHEKKGFLKVLEKDPSPKSVKSMANDMPEDKSKQATAKSVKKAKGDK